QFSIQDAPMSELKEPETMPGNPDVGVSNLVLAQLRAEIKDLRNQLSTLETHVKNTSLRGRVRRLSAKLFGMRLHKFNQYRPRELFIPNKYRQPVPLQNPPLISIVTPSYNQGRFLEQTILSVLDQDYPKLEYAVQDGGSKDETVAVLDRYRDRLIHAESRKDKGQGNAINLGFAHATRGEIMAYLNSDDLLLPGCLNYVAAYFAANPDVDVVYGHRVIIDTKGKEIGRWVLPNHSDQMLVWADYVPQETLFWRRSIWDKAGGKIDESFQFALDWDMLLRFRDAGAKFVRLPRFLGAFRVHESQKTSADMAATGVPEMTKLRFRVHGQETDLADIRRNMNGYMFRHAWHHFLYQIGLSGA
ncbi:MAG TPA: glycosyltransferase family 2 protein, partial [Gemmata sp.]|nr:glycosyltransferase family 2 protein [Gemmata sp.]